MISEGRKRMFPEVSDEQWNDWKWQVKTESKHLTS
jgi:hypothetical protein